MTTNPAMAVVIQKTLTALFAGTIALRVPSAGWAGTISGCYVEVEARARDAAKLDARGDLTAISVTANPADPDLLARAAHRFIQMHAARKDYRERPKVEHGE
jgi:hypothetical protein